MQTRSLEVGLGVMMFVSGAMFAAPGFIETAGPAYQPLRTWAPDWLTEDRGGWILVTIAFVRWVALAINSHHRSTPAFRLLGCIVGSAFWVTAAIGFSTAPLPAVPWIAGMCACFFAAEVYSALRTGFDAEALDTWGFRIRAYQKTRARKDAARA